MGLVLEKGASRKEIKTLRVRMKQRKSIKAFDARKYNGVIALKEDPLMIQKRLKDEWKRDFS